MATCPKCGRKKIRKSRDGLKWCRRCGCLTNNIKLLRGGLPNQASMEAMEFKIAS